MERLKQSAEQIQPEIRQTRPEKEAAVAEETMEAAEVVEEQDAESGAGCIHSAKDSKNAGRTEKG